MQINDYVEKMKNIYTNILEFIENEDNGEENLPKLINLFQDSKVTENVQNLKKVLCILVKIGDNHIRNKYFFSKIENILKYLKESIERTFSNFELFHIFRKNKRILLFLIEEKMIKIDQKILNIFFKKMCTKSYIKYFYPEIKDHLTEQTRSIFEKDNQPINSFDEYRKIGENEKTICNIIRADSIDDFIIYINEQNLSINHQIEPSIFETNQFLLEKQPSLIEYATFFGSIKIIQYLILNDARLTPSLWLYAVHGNNPEIINLLEEKNVIPDDDLFEEYFFESIKCHHNDFANYFQETFRCNLASLEKLELFSIALKYHNYEFFQDCYKNKYSFFQLCKYDYFNIVAILMKSLNFNIKSKISFKNRVLNGREKISNN